MSFELNSVTNAIFNFQSQVGAILVFSCKWHVRFIVFVTILLNRPYRSRRFIYFHASFSGKKHQGKIYKTQRILVANLATNFWILLASAIILVALATVLGAISCPVLGKIGPAAKPVNDIPLSCAFNPLCFCNCEVFCDLQRTIIALFYKEN